MQAKFILLILSWAFLIAGGVLTVLSFTAGLPNYYGGIAIGAGAAVSIAAIVLWRRDIRRRDDPPERKKKR